MNEVARTGASFARGSSKQDYATPWDFIDAVEKRAGQPISLDLAAHADNARVRNDFAGHWIGPGSKIAEDSLASDLRWAALASPPGLRKHRENFWLNPPFDTIGPWAQKCAESKIDLVRARILFLVPASVGSEWWALYVHMKSRVIFPRPRLSFDGKNPYPKDCALCVYGDVPGYECWRWR